MAEKATSGISRDRFLKQVSSAKETDPSAEDQTQKHLSIEHNSPAQRSKCFAQGTSLQFFCRIWIWMLKTISKPSNSLPAVPTCFNEIRWLHISVLCLSELESEGLVRETPFFHSNEPVASPNSFSSNFWSFGCLAQVMLRNYDCVGVPVSPVYINLSFWYQKCRFSIQMPPWHVRIQFHQTFNHSGSSYKSWWYTFVTSRKCWFH